MTSVVSSKSDPAVKPKGEKKKRLPRSVRKHIRHAKAALRREHNSADAKKAIEQLMTRLGK